ncbi:MAG TPA: tetratricopeptide repeat protein [Fimbriiglobus sp.]|nr:tetratricopeptide repeat protein [Fimbriiglobus sp.]
MRQCVIAAVVGLLVLPTAVAQQDPAALVRQARELRKQKQIEAAAKLYAQAADRAAAAAGENSQTVADVLDEHFEMLFKAGRYAECVPVSERLARVQIARSGKDSIPAAGAINQVALAYKLSGRVREAGPLYEHSLAVFRKLRPDSPDTAQLMHNLAAVYAATGRGEEAERLYLSGLKLVAEKAGTGHPMYSQGQHNLATFYSQEGRNAEAAHLFRQALAAKKKTAGPNDPTVAVSLNNLAGVLLDGGDARGAEKLLKEAIGIFEAGGYGDHPHAVVSRNMLAEAYRSQGRPADAAKLAGETLARLEKAVGKDDPAVAGCLVRLGHALKDQAKYTDAEATYKRAIAIRETKLEAGHPDTIVAWSLLADVFRASGRLDDAERLYRKAKVATDARYGKVHPRAADARRELAVCLTELGEYESVERLLTEARKTLEGNKRADPFALRRLDHATAELYRETGRLAEAGPLYATALKAATDRFGADHPLTTSWAYDAALLQVAGRKYADADRLLTASLAGREKTLGPNHPATLAALELLADVKQQLGRATEAEALARKALDRGAATDPMLVVRLSSNLALRSALTGDAKAATAHTRRAVDAVKKVEALYPFDDPLCWLARHNAGFVYAAAGDVPGAVAEFDAARRAVRRFLAEALPGLSEREQLFVLEKFDRSNLHVALNLGPDHATDSVVATRTAEWLLNGKAVAHEALAAAVRGTGAADRSPVRATLNLRRQAAGIAITPAATGRKRPADPWVSFAALQAALPSGSVFIDVVRLDSYRIGLGRFAERQPARYVAWVTGKTGAPKVIALGPADKIDAAVSAARKAIADAPATIRSDGEPAAEKKLRVAAADLSKLVLEPLKKAAGSATAWYVAPDGELWLYPWAALPTAGGTYLAEAVDVRYVTSGRDLLPHATVDTARDCVVVADPDFDAGAGRPRVPSVAPTGGRGVAALLGRVGRLPGTAVEARAVAPKLAALAGREPTVLTGERATERGVRLAVRPRVLMLATHGFYLPPEPEHRAAGKNWYEALTLPLAVGDEAVNPLRRSGLLLAGCNREPKSGDDGVLTGLDVLGLDLHGCELVVLSACETGLGEVRDGEGVGGLRQAFLAAGAKRVMSTLWQVPDLESARLMSRCFELQASGQPAGMALRQAQLETVRRRRDANAAAHPFFWSAYTLTGRQDTPR